MIILDTNVVAEAMRGPRANAGVVAWLRGLERPPVTTIITRAEILAGIHLLPKGRRRETLLDAAHGAFDRLGACLPLTPRCADHYAEMLSTRRNLGRPIGAMDALIASIARETKATVATRDEGGFEGLELSIINPFGDN